MTHAATRPPDTLVTPTTPANRTNGPGEPRLDVVVPRGRSGQISDIVGQIDRRWFGSSMRKNVALSLRTGRLGIKRR